MHKESEQCYCYENNRENFGYLFWRIMKLWQRNTQQQLDEFQTTTSQLEILGGIYHLSEQNPQEEVTQTQLSALSDIDPMTTSTILRNLEKKGFVVRKQSLNDTRARSVFITEAGSNLLNQAFSKMKRNNDLLLKTVDYCLIKKELEKLLFVLEDINAK